MSLQHLLSVWPRIAEQLAEAGHVLLLADFDGTLTPIVERPELAELDDDTWWLLRSLARQRMLLLGIISGRALSDLKERVGIGGVIYAGNHGLEIEGPGINFVNPVADELRPFFRMIHNVLRQALGSIRGVFVENKGLSLSVHYRQVAEPHTEDVGKILHRVVGSAEATGRARVTMGKEVYEVRPGVTWDKGKAVKLLMKKYGRGGRKSGLLPIYLGDDLTDEDAFRVIEDYGMGLSVYVGQEGGSSAAPYFLNSPEEVVVFLRRLLEHARQGFKQPTVVK